MSIKVDTAIYDGREFRTLSVKRKTALALLYQKAFAGSPWFEVAKCASKNLLNMCTGGYSSLAVGAICQSCEQRLSQEAYPTKELLTLWNKRSKLPGFQLYTETTKEELLLAAMFWNTAPKDLFERKYKENPKMQNWLIDTLPEGFTYLDEMFADTSDESLRPNGNLINFEAMIRQVQQRNKLPVMFRTINEGLAVTTIRSFGKSRLFFPGSGVPDRRTVLVIPKL